MTPTAARCNISAVADTLRPPARLWTHTALLWFVAQALWLALGCGSLRPTQGQTESDGCEDSREASALPRACDQVDRGAHHAPLNAGSNVTHTGTDAIRVGRLGFSVPSSFAVVARTQRLFRTYADTVAIGPQKSPHEVWKELVASFPPVPRESDRPPAFPLAPGVSAQWCPGSAPERRALLAMSERPGHVLTLWTEVETTDSEAIEGVLRAIAAGYIAGGALGFCVEHGCFADLESRDEQASITLSNREEHGAEIRLSTIAVGTVYPVDEVAATERQYGILKGAGMSVTLMQNRALVAAGVEGHESQIAAEAEDGSVLLRYDWVFAGTAADSKSPRIELTGLAPQSERAALDQAWKSVLETLRFTKPRA